MTPRITTPADLRAARGRLGLTQRQVADYLGVPSNTVSRLERGEGVRHQPRSPRQWGAGYVFDSRWISHLTLLFEALARHRAGQQENRQ